MMVRKGGRDGGKREKGEYNTRPLVTPSLHLETCVRDIGVQVGTPHRLTCCCLPRYSCL